MKDVQALRKKIWLELARYGRDTDHGTTATNAACDRLLALCLECNPAGSPDGL